MVHHHPKKISFQPPPEHIQWRTTTMLRDNLIEQDKHKTQTCTHATWQTCTEYSRDTAAQDDDRNLSVELQHVQTAPHLNTDATADVKLMNQLHTLIQQWHDKVANVTFYATTNNKKFQQVQSYDLRKSLQQMMWQMLCVRISIISTLLHNDT